MGKLIVMADATRLLDQQLRQLSRAVLKGGGSISTDDAQAHAKAQYKIFDARRRLARQQQTDAELAALKAEAKKLPKPRRVRGK
jgi:hypothetical protein